MPWLHTPPDYDRQHADLRASRGLATDVDQSLIEWKRAHSVPTYWIAALSFAPRSGLRSGLDEYPMADYDYDLAWLKWLDRQLHAMGVVRRESPRWDLMRRHVTHAIEVDPDRPWTEPGDSDVARWQESDFVVLTGMPVDQRLMTLLGESYDEVETFDPGIPWSEYTKRVMYDLGDAWYLPNYGIAQVERPGPQIRIFRRR